MTDRECENRGLKSDAQSYLELLLSEVSVSTKFTESRLLQENSYVLFYTVEVCGTRDRITSGRKLSNKLCS